MPDQDIPRMTVEQQDELIKQARIAGESPKMNKAEADALIAKMNPSKIIADSAPKIENAQLESMANERASKEPLPGAAADIFNTEPLTVKTSIGEVTIRPMVSFDINIFKMINSPFYQIIMGDKVKAEDNQLFASEEESYEMIYQFTHPCKEIYNLFKKGKEAYRDEVMQEVAFKYNPAEAALLVETIMSHIFRVNMARVDFTAPEPESDSGNIDGKKNLIPPATTDTIS